MVLLILLSSAGGLVLERRLSILPTKQKGQDGILALLISCVVNPKCWKDLVLKVLIIADSLGCPKTLWIFQRRSRRLLEV